MNKKLFALLAIIVLLVAACQASPAEQVEVTRVVSEQIEVTRIVEGEVQTEVVEVTRLVDTPDEEPQAEEPEQGDSDGVLTIAKGAIPTTGDPGYDTGAWSLAAYMYVFDTLVVFEDGEVQPSIATSWEAIDEQTWEFTLRDDVTFQNGEPLDANAVKFTIDRIMNPDEAVPWAGLMGPIESTEVIDETTIQIRTSEPFGPLVQKLLVAFIIPPSYYEEVGKEAFAQAPVGSGPFQWVDFDPITHLTVEPWAESWRWEGNEPGVTAVTWRKMPEASTRVAALAAGEVDVAEDIPAETISQLESLDIQIMSQPIAQTMVVNLRNTWDTPLQEMLVRQALNYAIDKQAIADSILSGHATLVDSQLIGADSFGYNPDLEPYPYDPDRARELLAEAGYPDGFEMTYHFSIGRYPKDKEVSEVIAAQLAEVGVQANLEYLENVVFSQMARDGTIGPMSIYGWQSMPAMDINQPIPFFQCETPRENFCDEELDRLIDEMEQELDPVAREANAQEMAAYLAETAPVIFLWQFHTIYGIQPYVEGFVPSPAAAINLTQVSLN